MSNLIELAEYIVTHAVKNYPNQIAIIAMYGSVAISTQTDYSDLDMYAIIDKEDPNKPLNNWSFIFRDRAIDLWSMDWKDAEEFASGKKNHFKVWCVAASLFINCKILYSRNKQDLERFNLLKKTVQHVREDNEGNIQRAISLFNLSYSFERGKLAKVNNDILSARWAVWGLINNVCAILSWLNNIYYKKNWGSNLQEVFQLPIIPENLHDIINVLVSSNDFDKLLSTGKKLISDIRSLIKQKQNSIITYNKVLNRNDVVHMKEYFNKIYAACDKKDIFLASYAATELQIWISEIIAQNKGIPANIYEFNQFNEVRQYYNELHLPDLTNFISNRDFEGLHWETKRLENKIMRFYHQHVSTLPIFNELKEVGLYLRSL